jgi:nitrogenase-stabilizing/protective protein
MPHGMTAWAQMTYPPYALELPVVVNFQSGDMKMSDSEFDLDLEELSSAEEFLEYFDVAYDPAVVQVNRLHILQRFHDYLDDLDEMPDSEAARRALYAGLLDSAYNDFVASDARTEKVFKVFRMQEPFSVEVPLTDLFKKEPAYASKI